MGLGRDTLVAGTFIDFRHYNMDGSLTRISDSVNCTVHV